ncbi:MAG: AAA family ATPase, partial [Oscillospiraceae bacterium]|nr:AAA family ATPase [Oscillospiraceae bacterium]
MPPLADRIRPAEIEEVMGQSHLLAPGKPLRKIIDSGKSNEFPCMLFYGPSGIGKTTVANIIASKTSMRLHKLNGTSASTADIKAIIALSQTSGTLMEHESTLLYLDEIQYLNKKQQQSLLEFIENG